MITIYGFKECSPCHTLCMELDRRGIPYSYVEDNLNKPIAMIYPSAKTEDGRLLAGPGQIREYLGI